jgi:hypothetical protein
MELSILQIADAIEISGGRSTIVADGWRWAPPAFSIETKRN